MKKIEQTAIILAGGSGSRMNTPLPKQFLEIGGKPVILHTLQAFHGHPAIDRMVVVVHPDHVASAGKLCRDHDLSKVQAVVPGGATRQGSSWNGLNALDFLDDDILIFHDAVRPFVTDEMITRCISMTEKHGAVTAAVPSVDTIAVATPEGTIFTIPDRNTLWNIQTPQCFRYKVIRRAHELAMERGKGNTSDDTALVLESGHHVFLAEGSYDNIKITTPGDIPRAMAIIGREQVLKKD